MMERVIVFFVVSVFLLVLSVIINRTKLNIKNLQRLAKKGQGSGAVAAIVAGFVVAAVIILFLSINSTFKSSIDRSSWTAEENNTYTSLTSNVNKGFNLASIMPIILVAVAVIGAVIGLVNIWK